MMRSPSGRESLGLHLCTHGDRIWADSDQAAIGA
jgi:hypothetical protein